MTVPAMFVLALIGLLSGGLLNYIACTLLGGEDLLSRCSPHQDCPHKLSLWEAIPLLSFFCPARNCQYCRRRLFFEYPLVEILTASTFLILAWRFHISPYAIGMMIFIAVLIAVCITDFKAKIIPHEITYPAIILGIIFSAQVRSDALGALAGIGVSYIIFDFLAFYGLQVYLWLNKPTAAPSQQLLSRSEKSASGKTSPRSFWFSNAASQIPATTAKSIPHFTSGLFCKGMPLEELEVIGGGDAVLAALISAWLGWRKLTLALLVSFLVGAVLGAVYLLAELWKQKLMQTLMVPVTICVLIAGFSSMAILTLLAYALQQPAISMQYLSVLPCGMLVGLLLGILIAGSKLSKPFPFGPALAAGAMVAIFT
jgi:leader peptidase (prepilin peptidase) / N-methyltransferase